MTSDFDTVTHAIVRASSKLYAEDYRDGDIVFFIIPAADGGESQAGYTVLADATHHYVFDPYVENATPKPKALPEGTQLFYHSTLPIHPTEMRLGDALAILWHAHDEALQRSQEDLLENKVVNPKPGELVLQERLDGYLYLGPYGDEPDYGPAPKKKHFWSRQETLVKRTYTQYKLLRVPVSV